MRNLSITGLLMACLSLAACGADQEPEGVLTQSQQRSLDKAQQLEEQMQQQARQREEQSQSY